MGMIDVSQSTISPTCLPSMQDIAFDLTGQRCSSIDGCNLR